MPCLVSWDVNKSFSSAIAKMSSCDIQNVSRVVIAMMKIGIENLIRYTVFCSQCKKSFDSDTTTGLVSNSNQAS